MSNSRFTLLLVCCSALVSQAAPAQTRTATQVQQGAGARLKMVVILSRHGVRPPLWTDARLDAYSVHPWPTWQVPSGELTAHGFQLLQRFGSYDRAWLAAEGLFAPSGCDAATATYIWADTDQRTLASGHALAQGLFPACPPEVHSAPTDKVDPLFHSLSHGFTRTQADAAFNQLQQRVSQPAGRVDQALIVQMQRVLSGCAPQASACTPQSSPRLSLLDSSADASGTLPESVVRGQGDHVVDLEGPLSPAASFSEDFLLEYADAMPTRDIGWGKVDEPQLRRFLALHTLYFDLVHRTPALAQMESSNLLSRIERTLQQGVESQSVEGALGSPTDKLVLLVGHDTNIAGIASLLGLHWNLDGRADDTPPDTQLAFELWQTTSGRFTVRITTSLQTLSQMRNLDDLTLSAPPAQQTVRPSQCVHLAGGCSWLSFRALALSATSPGAATHR